MDCADASAESQRTECGNELGGCLRRGEQRVRGCFVSIDAGNRGNKRDLGRRANLYVDFYRSNDGGIRGRIAFNFGQARPPFALIPTADNKKIYFTGKNLLVSADLGTGWSNIPSTADSFHSLAFTGGMLLLGGEKGLTPVALDGNTVRDIAPLPIGQFLAANLDSVNGVWAAGPAGLFGPLSTVVDTHTGGIGPVGGVAAASSGSNILASANGTLQISTDAGAQFAPKTVIADGELRAPFPPVLLDQTVTASAYVADAAFITRPTTGIPGLRWQLWIPIRLTSS